MKMEKVYLEHKVFQLTKSFEDLEAQVHGLQPRELETPAAKVREVRFDFREEYTEFSQSIQSQSNAVSNSASHSKLGKVIFEELEKKCEQ